MFKLRSLTSETWRYLTYSLVHQDWEHFVLNMSLQLVVGVTLELVHKWWRIAPLYIFGVRKDLLMLPDTSLILTGL